MDKLTAAVAALMVACCSGSSGTSAVVPTERTREPVAASFAAGVGDDGQWSIDDQGRLTGADDSHYFFDVEMSDLIIELDVERVAGSAGMGIGARLQVPGDQWTTEVGGYWFVVAFDGSFGVFACTESVRDCTGLAGKGYQPTDQIQGTRAHLRVEQIGETIQFSIDGVLVWSGSDPSWATGKLALTVGDGATAVFSNLRVWPAMPVRPSSPATKD